MSEPSLSVRLRIRRARRRLTFLALHAFFGLLGFERARGVGELLGELQYRFNVRSRRRQQVEIAALLGRPAADAAVGRQLRHAYRINTAAVMQIIAMFDRRIDAAVLASRCTLAGLEHLDAALAGGRGAILMGTHMGNGLLVPVSLAARGLPVSVVYREARMMSSDFFPDGLARYGIQGILANTGIRAYGQMLSALKQGRVVFLMMDQGVKRAQDGIWLRFLGKDMPMPGGPAQLARHARAPVLPVATLADRPCWAFEIEPAVPLPAEESVEENLRRLARASERQILRHPELWSWHHRRWRKFPLAGPPA